MQKHLTLFETFDQNAIRLFILTLFLSIGYGAACRAQNLDSAPGKERDARLRAIAKEVALRYGPDYYRDSPEAIVKKVFIPRSMKYVYRVTFPPKPNENFEYTFAAEVTFEIETSQPRVVVFGNGLIRDVSETFGNYLVKKHAKNNGSKKSLKMPKELDKEEVSPIKYQQAVSNLRHLSDSEILQSKPILKDSIPRKFKYIQSGDSKVFVLDTLSN